MFEGSMASYGWGYVGSNKRGFEWMFTPDEKDSAFLPIPGTNKVYPCCCVKSGDVFDSEADAVRDGKKWLKQTRRSGSIAAVKSTQRHFEY